MNWTTTQHKQLVRLRSAGVSFSDIAKTLEKTVGAVKFQLHQLPREIREAVAHDCKSAQVKRQHKKWNDKKRELRLQASQSRGRQGPMDKDPKINNDLINELYNGRKWDSYRFVGQNW